MLNKISRFFVFTAIVIGIVGIVICSIQINKTINLQKTMQEEHREFIDKDIKRMENNMRRYEREIQSLQK